MTLSPIPTGIMRIPLPCHSLVTTSVIPSTSEVQAGDILVPAKPGPSPSSSVPSEWLTDKWVVCQVGTSAVNATDAGNSSHLIPAAAAGGEADNAAATVNGHDDKQSFRCVHVIVFAVDRLHLCTQGAAVTRVLCIAKRYLR